MQSMLVISFFFSFFKGPGSAYLEIVNCHNKLKMEVMKSGRSNSQHKQFQAQIVLDSEASWE